jgi:hypothetical protein
MYDLRMRRFFLLFGIIFLGLSCATSSSVKKISEIRHEFEYLPVGASMYGWIDVKSARQLLDNFLRQNRLNTKTVKTFLDKTDTAAIAVYPAPAGSVQDNRRHFLLMGCGESYPAFFSSISLGISPAWEKKKSITGKKYWHSKKNRFSVFMKKNRTYISDGDPLFIEDGTMIPDTFLAFCEGAQIAVWVTDISPLNNILVRMDIPVTIPAVSLFIAGFRDEEDWQTVFRLETPSPAQARGLISVLTLFRGALSAGYIKDGKIAAFARLLLSESPIVDGSAIILKLPVITQAQLTGLAASLSIYLKQN